MKRFLLYCCLFCVCCSLILAETAVLQPTTDFPLLGPGLSYQLERNGDPSWAISILKIERSHQEYHLVNTLAQNTIFGLATVVDQVKGLPVEIGIPVAAVNGDWFEIQPGPYQGDLINMCIYGGQLISLPTVGDTFWLDANGQPHVDHVTTNLQLRWPDDQTMPLGLDGPRTDNTVVLYTPILGTSTRTTGGRELVLERVGEGNWLPLKIGQKISARVREVHESGDTPLTATTMILSFGPKLLTRVPEILPGDIMQISVASTPDLTGATLAMGGKPMLLKDGKIQDFGTGEQPRHPRTIFGWNASCFFLVVIDGRRPGWSDGMTVPELAILAQHLGCTNAINFDGGGSSTLWLDNRVMNLPSDGQPRAVGNALVLVKRPVGAAPNK